jgi:integrase
LNGNPVDLTISYIKDVLYEGDGKSRDVRWDASLPGFGVRVYPSGKKSFVLSYRHAGRKKLIVLGAFGDLTVKQAREKAHKVRVTVKDGDDPLEIKRKDHQGRTFRDLAAKYIADYAMPNKKTWREDQRRIDQHIPANWKSRNVSDINNGDIVSLYNRIREVTPYEANRLAALLHTMFERAIAWGFLDRGDINPAKFEKGQKFKEKDRKRFVRRNEMPHLAKAIDQESNIYIRSAIWLYLLTGMRKTELLSLRRDDVSIVDGNLYLRDTKAGEAQTVPLSKTAIAVIQAIPKETGNPYLLPGANKGRPLVNISKPWSRIREAATISVWADEPSANKLIQQLSAEMQRTPTTSEIEQAAQQQDITLVPGLLDIRLHDLRRTVGSWLTQSGVDLNIIKDALRHANIATTLTYARLGDDAARDAFEKHGERITEAAGITLPPTAAHG